MSCRLRLMPISPAAPAASLHPPQFPTNACCGSRARIAARRCLAAVACAVALAPLGSRAGNVSSAELVPIRQSWAHITYEMPKAERGDAYQALEAKTAALAQQDPASAEPLVWQAIILSTHAGVEGGLGALGKAKEARRLLLEAQRLDPHAMQASVYTTLGALYYQVPGWPLGFGDKDRARELLQKALALDPTGIDANYFYGDFLYRTGDSSGALVALRKALAAPPRESQPVADRGRREAAQVLIDTITHGS